MKSRNLGALACILIVVITMFLSVPSTALAKLTVLSPDEVISASDAVIVGIVDSKTEPGETLEVTIRVKRVLKGTVEDRDIEISVWAYMPGGKPPNAFPDEGTLVFVALTDNGNGGWNLATDLNAVGIVENGHVVTLHNGSKIGTNDDSWEPADYASAYDQFYRSHIGWFERVSEWFRNLI